VSNWRKMDILNEELFFCAQHIFKILSQIKISIIAVSLKFIISGTDSHCIFSTWAPKILATPLIRYASYRSRITDGNNNVSYFSVWCLWTTVSVHAPF